MGNRATVQGEPSGDQRPATHARQGQYARSTISSKGQMTLPVEVRKRLGVGAGDHVDFVFEDGRTVLKPVRTEENPFTKWRGIAPGTGGIKEILKLERELRGYDEWDEKDLGL